jgi:hypothetical protein
MMFGEVWECEQPMTVLKPTDLPWVFMSFREPNANENWLHLKQQIPEAVRSHGVVGLDQAHRAAAALIRSEYFFTLDGDSTVMDQWLTLPLQIQLKPHTAWCWRSKNAINHLTYGNGGVKLWHRSVIEHMNSHQQGVDFCWQSNYVSLNHIAGITNPGASERQAFVAGVREGVKLMLKQGYFQQSEQLMRSWNPHNRSAWLTWCVRGAHHEIHKWAPFGARYSAFQILTGNWLPTAINNWDFLSMEFDKLQASMQQYVENHCKIQSEYQSQVWKIQYEQLGECLRGMLGVFLPNCYDEMFWQWIDNCYHHKLGDNSHV